LPQRLADRRARHGKAPRDIGLVERRSRRQHAAHDLVSELQPQLFRARDLVPQRRGPIDAPDRRPGVRAGWRRSGGEIIEAHDFESTLGASGSSTMLTWAATISSLPKTHPGLHLPSHPARRAVAIEQRRGDRGIPP
jgi:hypothetical protein